jgi:hypothetical protein
MLLVLFALVVGAASARAAGPQLTVSVTHSPSAFERGDTAVQVDASITNTGDAPTSGPITAMVTLPSGLKLLGLTAAPGCPAFANLQAGDPFVCSLPDPIGAGEAVSLFQSTAFVKVDAPDPMTVSVGLSGGGVPDLNGQDSIPVVDRPPFDIDSFSARSLDAGGTDYTQAGGHPYEATSAFTFPRFTGPDGNPASVADPRNIWIELPPGFIGAATATPRCPLAKLSGGLFAQCPLASKVGTVSLFSFFGGQSEPIDLFNVVPEQGYPAEFGFKAFNNAIVTYPQVRSRDGGYGINLTVPGADRIALTGISAVLYGVPSQRNGTGGPAIPFLSNPDDCREAQPITRLYVDSWQDPAKMLPDGTPDLTDPLWKSASAPAPAVTGCDDPAFVRQFRPSIGVRPIPQAGGAAKANEPAGLNVELDFPQSNDPTNPNESFDPSIPQAPELKNATVTLPAGVAISPSAADGLGACSDLASAPQGDQVRYDDIKPVTCPNASIVGTVIATSPLLAAHDPVTDEVTGPEPIEGDVYLLKPHPGDLPQGGDRDGTYRLLIQLESERYGINVKLPGVAVANAETGQLTATFTENPQLPVKHLNLELHPGPRAPLSTPKTCGTFTTTTDLDAWSAPGTPDAHPTSSFELGSGSGCASSLSSRPFAPKFEAGTTAQKAGSSAPFVMNLSRGDGEQEFSSLDVSLPLGLTAKLAGVPYCSEAEIAAAKSRSGSAEQATPSCPAASHVGTLTTSAGPGSNPYTVTGNAYLAGPYKGAPLSLAFITPAVAGPFDLGNVVVRAAAYVDPETAQVTVKTDPIPQILDGVPLGIRSIQAKIDKPNFTLNPTSCEPKAVSATIAGSSGATANPANHFQVGDCSALGFKPKLKISLKGSSRRLGHPALRAVVTYPKQGAYANIARAQVNLPHSEFLDQSNLDKTCTKPVLLEGKCPARSIYGRAKAWTPLLEKPLEGPVYLVGGYGYKLPALVADLNGQIRVVLKGKVDSGPNKGIRNTFEAVPDAPVERFELRMKGGKKYGLLENTENLCAKPQRAIARFTAQTGMVNQTRPLISAHCGKRRGDKKKNHGKRHHQGHHHSTRR